LLIAAVLRLSATGENELSASDAAMAKGDWSDATVHARRAAAAYYPGAAHVERAYERLLQIARDAELRGDRDAALFAWWAVRMSSIGTRAWFAPHAAERAGADRAIARLSSGGPSEREELALLAQDRGPSPVWILLMGLGLAGWGAGIAWILGRGLSPAGKGAYADRWIRKELWRGGLLAAAGMCAWLLGLLLA
jgi:hypothetical protein